MNLMKYIISILFIYWTLNIYSQNIKDVSNFGFETDIDGSSGWQMECSGYKFKYDTTDHIEGERSIVFQRGGLNSILDLCIYQKILLPRPINSISVSVFSKNLKFNCAWLIIAGFDKSGKIKATDTVSITGNSGWKEFTAHIRHEGMYLLSIEIRAKEPFHGQKTNVKLWIDNISVHCNGQDLLSVETPSNNPTEREIDKIKKNIPLDTNLLLPETVLKKIARKKIIGFGETAHGSLDIDRFIYNNIRQLILKHNCKLVLFEMPIDLVAEYNLYIHGYTIDSINLKFYPPYTKIDTTYQKLDFISSEFGDFINWTRRYNSTHDNKVDLMGINLHTELNSSNETPSCLNRYISSMKLRSKTTDSLVSLINSSLWRRLPLHYALKNENEITGLMGRFNSKVLLQILKSRTDSVLLNSLFPYWSEWQYVHRDYIMWQNTRQVLESFMNDNSPVAICAHYAHLNKNTFVHFNEVVPLGQYLKETYGNDYYCLGILLGEGEVGCADNSEDKLGIQYLQQPVSGSLEYLALQTNQYAFYREGFIKSDKPLLIRRSGNTKSTFQFIPAYYPGCMDDFVFIRASASYFKE